MKMHSHRGIAHIQKMQHYGNTTSTSKVKGAKKMTELIFQNVDMTQVTLV